MYSLSVGAIDVMRPFESMVVWFVSEVDVMKIVSCSMVRHWRPVPAKPVLLTAIGALRSSVTAMHAARRSASSVVLCELTSSIL